MITGIPEPQRPPARYTSRPFPPYRYVPGLHPHPVAHPDGHSYDPSGAHPEAGALLSPDRWAECRDYLFGVDLYNHWYWWEAHEAWEGIWQQSDKRGPQGHFLQFLIQVSACHLQRHMGRTEGVQRLRRRARRHLESVIAAVGAGRCYMGLDPGGFADHADRWLDGETNEYPFIRLDRGQRSHTAASPQAGRSEPGA